MVLSTITRRAAWVRCSSSESASTSTSRKSTPSAPARPRGNPIDIGAKLGLCLCLALSTPTAALASEGASEALFENKCAGELPLPPSNSPLLSSTTDRRYF